MRIIAFTPSKPAGGTQTLSATSTSAGVVLSPVPVPNVHIYNAGGSTVYLAFGPSTISAAASTGIPVKSGDTRIFGISRQNFVAGVCSTSGTASVYVTGGEGGL